MVYGVFRLHQGTFDMFTSDVLLNKAWAKFCGHINGVDTLSEQWVSYKSVDRRLNAPKKFEKMLAEYGGKIICSKRDRFRYQKRWLCFEDEASASHFALKYL